MLAAGGRAIGVVNQDVIMASGAEHAVNGFAELLVSGVERVIGFRFRARHSHESKYTAGRRVFDEEICAALLFTLGKTGEGVQRKKFAKDLHGLPSKGRTHRD